MDEELLNKVTDYANEYFDGHFTLMKFTTNWRACYGTVTSREEVSQMVEGRSQSEALASLLGDPISVYDMD